MRKLLTLAIVLLMLLIAVPVSASSATLVVDDDGADCPDAGYTTIQAAVDAANDGDNIAVCTGTYAGATVDKTVHFQGKGNVVVNDGPNSHSFLRAGFLFPGGGAGSGSTIRGFRFEGTPQFDYVDDGHLDFAIFSRGANDVTIEHNVMVNTLQAITNWNGSGWTIEYNKIEGLWVLCGGGIGILVGAFDGTQANDNLVAHNTAEADDVNPDCGFYTTTGIVLYSSTRWGSAGGSIEGNRVLHNRSRVTGTWGSEPAGVGLEITDGGLLNDYPWSGDGTPDVIGNTIAFNDFRGSSMAMNFRPEEAETNNTVSRNLGKNRGQGETPASNLFH
jgi:hypothetical protein